MQPAANGTDERLDRVIDLLDRLVQQTVPTQVEVAAGDAVELREPARSNRTARKSGRADEPPPPPRSYPPREG